MIASSREWPDDSSYDGQLASKDLSKKETYEIQDKALDKFLTLQSEGKRESTCPSRGNHCPAAEIDR